MQFRLIDYLPILLVFIVAAGFAVTNIFISQFIGQRKRTKTKLMPYECGKDPVGSAHERFSVKFYLIAMIFILFDIEVICGRWSLCPEPHLRRDDDVCDTAVGWLFLCFEKGRV